MIFDSGGKKMQKEIYIKKTIYFKITNCESVTCSAPAALLVLHSVHYQVLLARIYLMLKFLRRGAEGGNGTAENTTHDTTVWLEEAWRIAKSTEQVPYHCLRRLETSFCVKQISNLLLAPCKQRTKIPSSHATSERVISSWSISLSCNLSMKSSTLALAIFGKQL